jgi:uncharacterized protein YndB with AHSA1/START domain
MAPSAKEVAMKGRKAMAWLIGIGGVLVLAAAVPWIVGRFMSPEYGGEVERTVGAPPAAVFAALSDYAALPHAGAMCKKVAALPDGGDLPAWTEDLGQSVVTVRTLEAEAPRRIVREMSDSVVPMKARWELDLVPDGAGTRVVLRHRGRIDDGSWHVPYFRFLVKALGMADRGARQYLEAVDARATR